MGLLDRLRSTKKVAVLGIDGVPFSLLERGMDEGWLENLASIEYFERMEAELPVVSSVCWPSATTGLNPGGTGVYGFLDRREGSDETYIPMSRDVDGKRIWEYAGDAGKNSLVVNVPVTFPPTEIQGQMVSGFLSPDLDGACTSPRMAQLLKGVDYRVDVDVSLHDERDKLMDDIHSTLDARLEALKKLVEEEKWDLFFGVVMETDRLNHFFWSDFVEEGSHLEDFIQCYREIDEFVGELRSLLSDGTELMVMSDHGFSGLKKEVGLNTWLEGEGLVERGGELASTTGEAYSMTPGRIYVDLESRRPGGSVPDDRYEEVREELEGGLRSLEDPETGESVIADVYTREELYDGPHFGMAPDLVAHPEDGYDLKASFEERPMFGGGPRSGMHTLKDASLLSTAELECEPRVRDVCPTALELLDIDHNALDGRSLLRQA